MAEVGGVEHRDGVGQRDGPGGDGVVEHVGHGGGVDLGGEGGEAGEVDVAFGGLGGLRVGQVADLEAKGANGTDGVAGQRDVDVEARVGERRLQQGAATRIARVVSRSVSPTVVDGAELLLNVVLTTTGDRAQEVVLAQANAIVNQVFVASVNAAAPRGQGRSLLVDPQGRILAAAVGAEPTVLAATIDLDEARRTGEHGTAGVTKPWSQFVETDRPIDLRVYEGRITPQTWRPKT